MDQKKIGKFIQVLRKEKGLTQEEFATKLGVTNRSVSKWENGNCMPDISLFNLICEEFDISVNELLSGERLNDDDYKEKANENLIVTIGKVKKEKKVKKTLLILVIFILLAAISYVIYANIQLMEFPVEYDSRIMKCYIEDDKVFYSFNSSILHPFTLSVRLDGESIVVFNNKLAVHDRKFYNFENYQNMANLNDGKNSIYKTEGWFDINPSVKTKVYYTNKDLTKVNLDDSNIKKLLDESFLMCEN